jgi:hypothetical protein
MFKEVLAGVSLSFLLVVSAFAQDAADPRESGGAVALSASEQDPSPSVVPGPLPVETPEAKAEVEYRFGVNGFFRGEGGGNFRLSDFSYDPGHSEGRFLYRVKPYAFWHPTDFLDFHLEGQGYGFTGGGKDDWQLALYQGYLEAKIPNSDLLSLKAGRQEFSYGSNFMLGPDAFYNGLTFDSGRLRIQPASSFTLDLLGGSYVTPWSDGIKGDLAAAYGTWTISEGNALEGYFIRDTGSLERHSGEVVNSFGARGTAKVGPLALEVEPVYQSGRALNSSTGSNDDISAFGGHADLTAELELGGVRHKLWTGYAAGSGGRAAAEGETSKHEFRNPNNDTMIVGDLSAFGDLSGGNAGGHHASGLTVYTLGWGVDLTKQLNLSATGHYFRAASVEQGLSSNLGLETDFILTYTFSDRYSLLLAYDRLFTGSFFKGATGSGDDIHYGYLMFQFNLEKSKLKTAMKGA